MLNKINFGCGADYRKGWINIDIGGYGAKWQGGNKPDIIIKPDKMKFPSIKKSSVDYILADNVLEHMDEDRIEELLLEFHRILKPRGVVEIYVPHFKGILVKFLEHKRGYGINSFWHYKRYFYIKQKLFLINRNRNAGFRKLLFLNKFNFLFNVNEMWQQLCEKFLWFGFEEIRYLMIKRGERR